VPSYGYNFSSWPASSARVAPGDFDADGKADLLVDGVDGIVIGARNQLVFANAGVSTPNRVVTYTNELELLHRDLEKGLSNPSYFDAAFVNTTLPAFQYAVVVDFNLCVGLNIGSYFTVPFCFQGSQVVYATNALTLTEAQRRLLPVLTDPSFYDAAKNLIVSTFQTAFGFGPSAFPSGVIGCLDVCGSGSGSYAGQYYSYSIYDVFVPLQTVEPVFDQENYSLLAFDTVGLPSLPALGDVVTKAPKITPVQIVIGAVIEIFLDLIDDQNQGITDGASRAVVINVIEQVCALSNANGEDPEVCLARVRGILNSDIIHNSEINDDVFDDDWLESQTTAVAVALRKARDPSRVFCTYTKTGPSNKKYFGRTSGASGETCADAVPRRDLGHIYLNQILDFGKAFEDRGATGLSGYESIRGREQQLIDNGGGPRTTYVQNKIRGVAKANRAGCGYHVLTSRDWGKIADYTGDGTCLP
jgi:hypothetical protein